MSNYETIHTFRAGAVHKHWVLHQKVHTTVALPAASDNIAFATRHPLVTHWDSGTHLSRQLSTLAMGSELGARRNRWKA